MSKTKSILIIIMVLAICISPIYGASNDWAMFQQNVNHEGFIEEATDYVSNLWSYNMGSPINSTPVIHGDMIYVVSTNGFLKAINMEDGSNDWSINLGTNVTASPVIQNGILYIGGEDGYMYAYDINNQNLNIRKNDS